MIVSLIILINLKRKYKSSFYLILKLADNKSKLDYFCKGMNCFLCYCVKEDGFRVVKIEQHYSLSIDILFLKAVFVSSVFEQQVVNHQVL